MIAAIDAFLINRVFQPVVDASQRTPVWWVRQTGVLFLIITAMSGALVEWHWSVVLVLLIMPVGLFVATSSPAMLAMVGDVPVYRKINIVVTAVGVGSRVAIVMFLDAVFDTRVALSIACLVVWLALVCFAACRPPAPPRRRESRIPGRFTPRPL